MGLTSRRVMSPEPHERSTTVPVTSPSSRKLSSSTASLSMPGKPALLKFCRQPLSSGLFPPAYAPSAWRTNGWAVVS
jgi:hypothetical protein